MAFPRLWSAFGLADTTPECNTDDVYSLLIAVLPIFIAIAERIRNGLPDASDSENALTIFYLRFNTHVVNLFAVLVQWDPTETVQKLSSDDAEVKKNLMRILDQLEGRFVSQNVEKAGEAALSFRRLGFQRREGDTYPKLRALRRTLPKDGNLGEGLLMDIDCIMRVHNKSIKKQNSLLENLEQSLHFFYNLQPFAAEFGAPCPIRFSDYPLKHIRKLTRTLFEVVQTNWRCECSGNPSHVSRKTRLNLTQHQRFETAPANGQVLSNTEARFRILFPTSFSDFKWQDTEILVHNRE